MPPPFGKTLAIFQSVTFGVSPWITPSIHAGQSIVAYAPLAMPAAQSLLHWIRCEESVVLAFSTEVKAALTSGLVVAITVPSLCSKKFWYWLASPWKVAPAESNHAAPVLAAANFWPTA